MLTRALVVVVLCLGLSACPGTPPRYSVTDLGELPTAVAINNNGTILFFNGLYSKGVQTALPSLGIYEPNALSFNNSDQVVGYTVPYSHIHAFLYANGVITEIDNRPDGTSYARDINERGQVVGNMSTADGNRAFLYSNGDMSQLTAPGITLVDALAINNSGQVLVSSDSGHTLIYSNGAVTDLGVLTVNILRQATRASINNSGQVVGTSSVGKVGHAFLYSNGKMNDLGTLNPLNAANTDSYAIGINNKGDVIGKAQLAANSTCPLIPVGCPHFPFIYNASYGMQQLSTLIDGSVSGSDLSSVDSINDLGQIVGYALVNGVYHLWLLTPVPTAASASTSAKK